MPSKSVSRNGFSARSFAGDWEVEELASASVESVEAVWDHCGGGAADKSLLMVLVFGVMGVACCCRE